MKLDLVKYPYVKEEAYEIIDLIDDLIHHIDEEREQ